MVDISISKLNDVYIKVSGEQGILQELSEIFTFFVEGYRHMPAYKSKKWDGKIRLLKLTRRDSGKIYSGLLTDIINYCDSQNYTCQVEPILLQKNHINEKEIEEYIKKLNLTAHGNSIEARDYQIKTIVDSIKNRKENNTN
jgi:hypothetical protein